MKVIAKEQASVMMRFLAGGCVALAFMATGCSTWKVDKSVSAPAEQVATISREIEHIQHFQRAVHDVSIFAVDRCTLKTAREPFSLITVGNLEGFYDKTRIVAYWQAAGFDETWRVLWTVPGSGVSPGERVTEINGTPIDNNKSGMGEYPLVRYIDQTSRARDAAAGGAPYVLTLDGGRKITMKTRPACRTLIWSMPLFDADGTLEVSPAIHGASVLPPNAIREAQSVDEYRYLAGLAVYLTASEAAVGRGKSARVLLGLGALGGLGAIISSPVVGVALNPLISLGSGGMANAVSKSSAGVDAAIFAGRIVADMGGDPLTGLALTSRLEGKNLKANGVLLSEAERQMVRLALSK